MREFLHRMRRALMPWRRRASPLERLRGEVADLRSELREANRALADLRPQFLEFEVRAGERFHWLVERLSKPYMTFNNLVAPVEPDYSLEACFAKLQARAPRAFALWRELLDVNAEAYHGFPIDSCSVDGHPVASEFRRFLLPYLSGPVLDIGCGPQPVPSYLRGYPFDLIAGVDPLQPPQEHPFTFVQGVAEYLPWQDATFQLVVASTSMDHVLLLDRSLEEIHRVLRVTGRFVTWVAFVPGAARYDPYSDDVRQIDRYHLFHFDRPWFEKEMNKYFILDQEYAPDSESRFWSFRPRPISQVMREAA